VSTALTLLYAQTSWLIASAQVIPS
jgi:hypothetical protein